jgi:preprotein translocase subunit Sec61beta
MVEFFKNLPWWIQYPGKALVALCGGYVSNHPEIFPPWAVMAGAVVALWVVLAFLWHALNAARERKEKPRLRLDPQIIIVLFLFAALATAIFQWWSSKTKLPIQPATAGPVTSKQQPSAELQHRELIKNIRIEGVLHPQHPLVLTGEIAEHISRVRIVIEVKGHVFSRWLERWRIELNPISEKLKGDQISIPLISYLETPNPQNPERFYWGEPRSNYQLLYGPTLARILLTDSRGEDQAPFYFMLFRGAEVGSSVGDGTHPKSLYILQGPDLDWQKLWEEK